MSKKGLGILILTSLACATAAQAQTSSTTGAVRGTVSVKGGKGLAGATVLLRSQENGLSRTMVTGSQGEFLVGLLPTGTYEITVTAPAMRTLKDGNIKVLLGQSTPVNFTMDKAEVGAVVEVVEAAGALDKTEVSNMVSIDEHLVESMPINGRNFTDLVKLTPGAVTGDQGRQLMEGARGIMNNLTIDGASYNSNFYGEQRGSTSTPFAFGLDTIKELQVITDPVDPMYGNAAGGVINAVTKNGGNQVEGSAMVQFRPSSLVALRRKVPNDFSSGGVTNSLKARTRDFSQEQFNVNVGGPIVKDKMFFYVGVEAYHFTQSATPYMGVGTLNNSQAQLDAFKAHFGGLIMGPDGHTLAQEDGLSVTQDKKNIAAFARFDWNINENHRFDLRVNSQQFTNKNGSIPQSTSTGLSDNGKDVYNDISWVLELNSTFGAHLTNEARLQFASERRPRTPNTTTTPELLISGGGISFSTGQIWYEPSNLNELSKQFIDTVTYLNGDWTLKAGLDIQWFDFQNQFPQYRGGYFSFDSYASANAWATGTAFPSGANVSYKGAISATNGWIDYSSSLYTGFVGVTNTSLLDHRLTVVGGFRVTSEQAAKNPSPNANFVGCDSPNTTTSIDPRLGLTYDVFGNGMTLVKGSYGWFSSPNPSLTVSNTMTANGNNIKVYTLNQSVMNRLPTPTSIWFGSDPVNNPLSFQNRVSGGTQLTALNDTQLLAFATTPVLTGQLWDPRNELPLAKRTSLGVEHKLPGGFVVGARAEYAEFSHQQYFVNVNLGQRDAAGGVVSGAVYNDGYPTTINNFTTAARPGHAIIHGRDVNLAGFGDVFLSKNDGRGRYKAIVLTASRTSDNGFGFQSSFSFARQSDMNSNERVTNNGGSGGSVTNNPGDPRANMAPGDYDVHFRGVFAGYMPIYWGIKGVAVLTYQTGLPFSATSPNDINGDGAKTDYAVGYGGRNAQRQPATKTFDLRFIRNFQVGGRFSIEGSIDIFNALNWANWSTSKFQPYAGLETARTPNAQYRGLDVADNNSREVQFGLRLRF